MATNRKDKSGQLQEVLQEDRPIKRLEVRLNAGILSQCSRLFVSVLCLYGQTDLSAGGFVFASALGLWWFYRVAKAEEGKMRLFGWSFIYFLMSSKEGQGMLKNLIWEMNEAAGAEPGLWNRIRFKLFYNDNLEIVKRAIPRELETLDREWRAWIQQQREKHVFMFSAFNASQ